jgi:hypothetical protein
MTNENGQDIERYDSLEQARNSDWYVIYYVEEQQLKESGRDAIFSQVENTQKAFEIIKEMGL